ncbi:MAG TPA: Gldg family protein [Allosphingosinicella sp.]|jgi:hypothetical protein
MPTTTRPEPSLPRNKARRLRVALIVAAAAALLAALLLWRGSGKTALPDRAKPQVLMMTALPIVWGEGGAFDPASRPAPFYTELGNQFTLQPIDALSDPRLPRAKLLLLIQPRWLAPSELVALDAWVRSGGRALILTDPHLDWPSDLPLGDIRRPPPTGLLAPLLGHWGLTLEAGAEGISRIDFGGRSLAVENPGRLTATGGHCTIVSLLRANCRIGAGKAIVLADVDLVRGELWQDAAADNPQVIAALLDTLASLPR